jgi:hypothetical protein
MAREKKRLSICLPWLLGMMTSSVFVHLGIALFLAGLVYFGYGHWMMALVWFVNVLVFGMRVGVGLGITKESKRLVGLGLVIALLPVLVRLVLFVPDRIHGDDMVTAYFSAHYDWVEDNFFGAVPRDRGAWVSQFPSIYFVGQKLVFSGLGVGVWQTMVSTLPYVYFIGFSLYWLGMRLASKKVGIMAVGLYALFFPSLYLETVGLHFTMSVAMYSLLLVGLLEYFLSRKAGWAWISGMVAGFCYLAYTSSYIALLVAAGFFAGLYIVDKARKKIVVDGGRFILGFLIVWMPFGVFLLSNNYLVQRTDQVAFFEGEWSSAKSSEQSGDALKTLFMQHVHNSLRDVLVEPIEGHGGYNFGNQRMFTLVSMAFLVVGVMSVGYELWRKRISFWWVIILSVVISFFAVIFSIPPPAMHRFSLAFPLLSLIMAMGFYGLWSIKRWWVVGLVGLLFAGYGWGNVKAYISMAREEQLNDSVVVAQEVGTLCHDRVWYMAAYPNFALSKIMYVVSGGKRNEIRTDYHNNLIMSFNPDEKYCYLILFPEAFNQTFMNLDENGKIYQLTESFSLFKN